MRGKTYHFGPREVRPTTLHPKKGNSLVPLHREQLDSQVTLRKGWRSLCFCYSHVKQHIMLGTDSQVLPDGAHLRANVLSQDVGSARSWGEQASED